MYLCICKAVSDNQIRQAVARGARTVGDVSARLGAGTECGQCLDSIRDLLDAVLTEPSTGGSPRPEAHPVRPSLPAAGSANAWTAMFADLSTPAEPPSEPSESSSRGPAQ
ncbi:MAG: (2Fe-2S)-binding protein [Candidatus Competibacteraceae bacterium]|nr:(2Fe-2S)-binding protein [Candidatus Competibacteraceae bacterium]